MAKAKIVVWARPEIIREATERGADAVRLAQSRFGPTVGNDVRLVPDTIEQRSALVDRAVDLTRYLDSEEVEST